MSDTIDFTSRGWGHDLTWRLTTPDGTILRAMGWSTPLPKDGDYAILSPKEGGTTRYRFADVRYMGDPRDMWSATLHFAPREESVSASEKR